MSGLGLPILGGIFIECVAPAGNDFKFFPVHSIGLFIVLELFIQRRSTNQKARPLTGNGIDTIYQVQEL